MVSIVYTMRPLLSTVNNKDVNTEGAEVEAAGYKLLWRRDHAPEGQYIAMFQLP